MAFKTIRPRTYNQSMTKREKLWNKAQTNPQNFTFKEFETLLEQSGWLLAR